MFRIYFRAFMWYAALFFNAIWYRIRYWKVFGKTPEEARKLGYKVRVVGTYLRDWATTMDGCHGRLNVLTKDGIDPYGNDGRIYKIKSVG